MSTRKVTFTIKQPNGEPWPNPVMRFALEPGSYDTTTQYPRRTVRVQGDEQGVGEVTLWTNEVGEKASVYVAQLPSGEIVSFTLPAGSDPIDLSLLRQAGITPYDPQYETLLTYIKNDPDFRGEPGPGVPAEGFTGQVALTEAEYDALISDGELDPEVVYFVRKSGTNELSVRLGLPTAPTDGGPN